MTSVEVPGAIRRFRWHTAVAVSLAVALAVSFRAVAAQVTIMRYAQQRSTPVNYGLPDIPRGFRCMTMAEIVLRVRLIGGEHLDVTYEEDDGGAPDEIVGQIISTLAEANGVLRCRHGGRLIVLYGRGIATLEVAPRGPVL